MIEIDPVLLAREIIRNYQKEPCDVQLDEAAYQLGIRGPDRGARLMDILIAAAEWC